MRSIENLDTSLHRSCILFVATVSTVAALAASSQAAEGIIDSIDAFVTNHMDSYHIPRLAVAAVYSGEIIWTGTYGFGNIEDSKRVSENTIFQIASVSKPITATILLSIDSQNLKLLDNDINAFIPFEVRNPLHPEVPITVRQLLRHRSSIVDNLSYLRPFWRTADGDPTVALGVHLKDYLTFGGAHYSTSENFHSDPPGASRVYCNS